MPQPITAELESAPTHPDLETIFLQHYPKIARLIAGISRDPARAEELAVDVFLKWPSSKFTDSVKAGAWLHRAAVRQALDELRRQKRRDRLNQFLQISQPRNPEEIHLSSDRQARVAEVLSNLRRRDAEILILSSQGMTYAELAAALSLNPGSIGTLLARAQNHFRKEYIKRYGKTE